MRKVYIQQENAALRGVLNETYEELLAAVRKRNPKAESLIEDDEYSRLHDLLALLRLGHIKIHSGENERGVYMMLEIGEKG